MSDALPVEEMSFEDAMAELEQVLSRLERGDVALDQSISLYERGAKLKARCEAKLKEAEEKVTRSRLTRMERPRARHRWKAPEPCKWNCLPMTRSSFRPS